MTGEIVSHYKIMHKLGQGGMGEVFLAHDMDLDRNIALKFLPPEYATDSTALTRFRREARAAASLKHPNIITIHEIGSHRGKLFIAMEHVDGTSVRKLMEARPLSADTANALCIQVCDGLSMAHRAGIVHRDIKPENLIVDRENHLKILDFGLARMNAATTLTAENVTLGTVMYMSPEQARGDRVDFRSDIFSLGAVLYEMLAGVTPFRGERPEAILYQITAVDPPPLTSVNSTVSPEIERIVARALAKEPSARYQSAADFATDLRRAIGDTAALDALARRKRLRRYVIMSSSLAIVAILAIVARPWRFEHSPNRTATGGDRLAVMYFENVANPEDPERMGEIATNLLITDLAEARDARVVSSQRLYDILKQDGHEGATVISREIATEVARKAGARLMLIGSILRTTPQIEITSQIVDVKSGESHATQRIRGLEGEDIFSLVNRLSEEVRSDLGLSTGGGASVVEATTRSVEAYRYYLEGRENMNRSRYDAARTSYERAVQADTSFALAWIELTRRDLAVHAGVPASQREQALAKASAHANRVGRKERLYIQALSKELLNDKAGAMAEWRTLAREFPDEKEAYYEIAVLEDDADTSIVYLQKAIAIDPLFKPAFKSLAYHYQLVGDIQESIWAANQYIHLAPEDAEGYVLQANLYGLDGEIERAIASLEKAVAVDPDASQRYLLCELYAFVGKNAAAKSCWNDALKGPPIDRSVARYRMAASRHLHGHVDEAIAILEQTTVANELDGYEGRANSANHLYLSNLWTIKGDSEQAQAEYDKAMNSIQDYDWEWKVEVVAIRILKLARVDPERAEAELSRLAKLDPDGYLYWQAKCEVEMGRGRYELAIEAIDNVKDDRSFGLRHRRGVAYLRAGRYDESIPLLAYCARMWSGEKAITPEAAVEAHYQLGLAYEHTGKKNEAIEQYQRFIDLWAEADAVYADLVNDARQRLQRLQ